MTLINTPSNLRTQQILTGVNILLKYDSNATFRTVNGLDAIIFGDSEQEVSYEDGVELMELGWFLDTYYTYSWAYWI